MTCDLERARPLDSAGALASSGSTPIFSSAASASSISSPLSSEPARDVVPLSLRAPLKLGSLGGAARLSLVPMMDWMVAPRTLPMA